MNDGQRSGDDDRTLRREEGKIGELRQAVFARSEQEGMAGKRRIKAVCSAGIGTDRLHTDSDDWCFAGQPARTLDRDTWGVRSGFIRVQKALLVAGSRIPTC